MRTKILILGCGRFGAKLASENSSKGEDVIVVDSDASTFNRLDDNFSGLTVVGDVTLLKTLDDAGIEDAKEVVIATGSDNVNLLLANICATIYKLPHVIVRFNDPEKGLLIQGMPIRAIYPFELAHSRYISLKMGGAKK